MGWADDFDYNQPQPFPDFDLLDFGPDFIKEQILMSAAEFGKFVRQANCSDAQLVRIVVENQIIGCLNSGSFTPGQVANIITLILVEQGGLHRRQHC